MIFGFGKKKKEKLETEKVEELIEDAGVEAKVVEEILPSLATETLIAEEVATKEIAIEEAVVIDTPKEVKENKPIDSVTEKPKKSGYFSRLVSGLSKTGAGFSDLFLGKKHLDDDLLEELETALLMADVGIESTEKILAEISDGMSRQQIKDPQAVLEQLKKTMSGLLDANEKPLQIEAKKPFVILMVGINGAGKTTTIGKLSEKYRRQGKSVMLAAGDTFRAAAVEQLKTWGERTNTPVISQGTGADSASVIYDAYQSAQAKGIDILIADTAGRLHTQTHLMSEIEKVVRVLKKNNPEAPHEIMLVVDAGNGQNALNQAKEFNKALGLTGITITKLDGTAKGGIIFSIANHLDVPVRFIGVGEGVDDLREFNSHDFVEALLNQIAV